jgi:integrase
MERAVADAGVTDFRLHDTRHTTATRIARKSNLKVAQKLLGHSDIRMTLRYVHAMQDDVRDALEAISRAENCTETEVKAVKD